MAVERRRNLGCAHSNVPGAVSRKYHTRLSAFTLMELMVVLVLIGIMTAMILPEMKGTFEDALLRSSARKLVDVFSLTSSQAVSRNQLHRVRLDPGTGRYLVERRRFEKGQEDFVPLPDLPGSDGEVDSRISIEILKPGETPSEAPREAGAAGLEGERSAQGTTFAFYPDGTADAGGILLRDRQGFQLALRLNPTTAHVSIIEVERQ
jgi:type II secretion system protein H